MSNINKQKKKEKKDEKEEKEKEEHIEENDNKDNSEDIFEVRVENLLLQATMYQSMDTTDKIQNIEQYNSIIATTNEYEEILDGCKERLNNIENMKKKKVVYNNKTFSNAMDKIIEIKQKTDSSSSLEELLTLYEELMNIQVKMIPYLETKKMEIVKI